MPVASPLKVIPPDSLPLLSPVVSAGVFPSLPQPFPLFSKTPKGPLSPPEICPSWREGMDFWQDVRKVTAKKKAGIVMSILMV
jgi:hypothetical protein